VLYSGVACITDLMVKEGLINLDFADVRTIMRGMGKAMMGTGEASGEKRAIRAAEAAIANPLLDEVCMKGARGLLISITGGNDLTLYEVDEAATRIREEVDQEANIILGATFDESLEGIVRVSVVATGIDHGLITKTTEITATEQRIAEVAERLRAEARARVTPLAAAAPALRPAAQPEATGARSTDMAPIAAEPAPAHTPLDRQYGELPVQPVVHNDVILTPTQSKQAVAFEPQPMIEEHEEETAHFEAPYIPPQAERPLRATRMPRVDELPLPAQNQLKASRGEPEPSGHEHKRMTLLQRLATVGFGRKDEGAPVQSAPVEPPQAPAPRPVMEAPRAPALPVHAEYTKRPAAPAPAYRPAQGTLDNHGRAPVQPRFDDDQLEIPAFLRRQSN
jgi:cell division protein FtsZ